MVSKLKKDEDARAYFRSKYTTDAVAKIERDDVNYNYKLVISNYKHHPKNVENHLDIGYEFVYSDELIEDDRKYSPNSSDETKLRPSFVTRTTKDGYKETLLRILKTREIENLAKDAKERREKYLRATHSNKVSKQGDSIKTVLPNVGSPDNSEDI